MAKEFKQQINSKRHNKCESYVSKVIIFAEKCRNNSNNKNNFRNNWFLFEV